MENPFIYGEVVSGKNFGDREKELVELVSDLKSGQNIILYSPRRYGKTSLLLKILSKLKEDGLMTAYMDMTGVTSKHKFNENSKKTIEGYLAGSSMTFLIVVLMSGIYQAYMPVTIAIVVTMAFVAAMLFLLVDATSDHITDNILNPILTGLGMWWIILLF